MVLIVVESIDDLLSAPLSKSEQSLDLLRRVLQVVVHCNYMRSARMAQPRHDCVVLSIVSCEFDQCDGYTGAVDQSAAHIEAVVGTAVIYEYDLVSAFDPQLFQCMNQLGDTGGSVVDWDHD